MAGWQTATFTDTAWLTGRSRLGFGGDGENTFLVPGKITYWFRKAFTVPAGLTIASATLKVQRDDGIQLFLNGNRIWLEGLTDPVDPDEFGTTVTGADEQTWVTVPLPAASLAAGNNLFAAEVHQASATSSDLALDLNLDIQWVLPGGVSNTQPAGPPPLSLVKSAGPTATLAFPETQGRVYRIESSADLRAWTTENTVILGPGGYSAPLPAGARERFYRARWLPGP